MRRIILISKPSDEVLRMLEKEFFTPELNDKNFAYMPANGNNLRNHEFTPFWKKHAEKCGAHFLYIHNGKDFDSSAQERYVVSNAYALMITGGNTFTLMHNLRASGLDTAVRNFFNQEEYKFLGMSAGALVISPSIRFALDNGFAYGYDDNDIGMQDLNGLNIIDFIPAVHFDPEKDGVALERFSANNPHQVKTISNEGFILID